MTTAVKVNSSEAQARILFVSHTGDLGGAEVALLRLLRELDRHRFEPSVLLFAEGPLVERLEVMGVRVRVLSLPSDVANASRHSAFLDLAGLGRMLALVPFIWRLGRVSRAERFDIMHTNSLKAGVIGGLAARLASVRHVWHLHDRIAQDYMPSVAVRVMRFLIRRLPDFLIANSLASLDTVHKRDADGVAVIYPGVEIPEPGEAEAKRTTAPVVGLVGRISRTKGQDIFLRAAARVLRDFPNVRFQVIGGALFNDHPFEVEVRELAKQLQLGDAVEFTGFLKDVEPRIAALDILVHASPTPEPFGQVAAEGMAAGKPVIATRAGGIPEIVIHEETGLLVTPGDADELAKAIGRLLSDPKLAARLAAGGRERAAEYFSIQRSARQVEQVYARLLGFPETHNAYTGGPQPCEHLAA